MGPSLRRSLREGRANALMMGSGEGYLSAFAVFLSAQSFHLGLLATAPLLIGSASQLGMVHLMERLSRRKRLVIASAFAQAILWLLVFLLPMLGGEHAPALLVVAAIPCVALGSFLNPAWISWIGELTDPGHRGDYFGRRERIRSMMQLAGVLLGGAILSVAREWGHEAAGFGAVFVVAFVSRLASVHHLSLMEEPLYRPVRRGSTITLLKFLKRSPIMNFGRFTLYVALLTAAMNLAGPFFSLYMLRDLHFSYVQFTSASAVGILLQSITLHNWGRVADRFGNRTIIALTGGAIPFLPLLWIVSPTFAWVLLVQAVSGVVRAGFNLSTAAFLFDAVAPALRARCVAYYSILVNLGGFVGALVGGWIGLYLPYRIGIGSFEVGLISNLYVLFVISALVRLLVTVRFLPVIREVKPVEESTPWEVMFHVVGMSPVRGLRLFPIDLLGDASDPDPGPEGGAATPGDAA